MVEARVVRECAHLDRGERRLQRAQALVRLLDGAQQHGVGIGEADEQLDAPLPLLERGARAGQVVDVLERVERGDHFGQPL